MWDIRIHIFFCLLFPRSKNICKKRPSHYRPWQGPDSPPSLRFRGQMPLADPSPVSAGDPRVPQRSTTTTKFGRHCRARKKCIGAGRLRKILHFFWRKLKNLGKLLKKNAITRYFSTKLGQKSKKKLHFFLKLSLFWPIFLPWRPAPAGALFSPESPLPRTISARGFPGEEFGLDTPSPISEN